MQTTDYVGEDRKAHWEAIAAKAMYGESHGEEYFWELGGSTHFYDLRLTPIRVEGEIVGTAEFTRDITARRRAEEALRESEH
jgi:PAS domain S-box-containing protein